MVSNIKSREYLFGNPGKCRGIISSGDYSGLWEEGTYVRATRHWSDKGVHEDWIVPYTVQNGGVLKPKGYPVADYSVEQFTGNCDMVYNPLWFGNVVATNPYGGESVYVVNNTVENAFSEFYAEDVNGEVRNITANNCVAVCDVCEIRYALENNKILRLYTRTSESLVDDVKLLARNFWKRHGVILPRGNDIAK